MVEQCVFSSSFRVKSKQNKTGETCIQSTCPIFHIRRFTINAKITDDAGDGPVIVDPPVPNPKPIIGKGQIKVDVLQRLVSIYDTDGKLLKQESIEDYTKESILGTYQTLENFIQIWNGEQKKEIIRNMTR